MLIQGSWLLLQFGKTIHVALWKHMEPLNLLKKLGEDMLFSKREYFKGKLWWLVWLYYFTKCSCYICTCAILVSQSCPALCNPLDCKPPGSSVHEIFQARILRWVGNLPSPGIKPTSPVSPALAGRLFTPEPSGKLCLNQLCVYRDPWNEETFKDVVKVPS